MRRNENKRQISFAFSRSSQLSNFVSICISTTSFHHFLSIFSSLTSAMSSRRVFIKVKKITYRAIAIRRASSSSISQIRDNQFQSTLNFFAFIFFEFTFFSSQMNRFMIEVEIKKTTQLTTRKKTKQIAQLKKLFRVLKRNRLFIEIFDSDSNDDRRFFLNNDNEFVFLSLIKMFLVVNKKHFQDI